MHTPSHAGSFLTHKGTHRDPEAPHSSSSPPDQPWAATKSWLHTGLSSPSPVYARSSTRDTAARDVVSSYPSTPNPQPVLARYLGHGGCCGRAAPKAPLWQAGARGRDLSSVQPPGAYIARLPVLGSHSPCSNRLPSDSGPHSHWLQRLFSEM